MYETDISKILQALQFHPCLYLSRWLYYYNMSIIDKMPLIFLLCCSLQSLILVIIDMSKVNLKISANSYLRFIVKSLLSAIVVGFVVTTGARQANIKILLRGYICIIIRLKYITLFRFVGFPSALARTVVSRHV